MEIIHRYFKFVAFCTSEASSVLCVSLLTDLINAASIIIDKIHESNNFLLSFIENSWNFILMSNFSISIPKFINVYLDIIGWYAIQNFMLIINAWVMITIFVNKEWCANEVIQIKNYFRIFVQFVSKNLFFFFVVWGTIFMQNSNIFYGLFFISLIPTRHSSMISSTFC